VNYQYRAVENEFVWKNGNAPIALQPWEYLGGNQVAK